MATNWQPFTVNNATDYFPVGYWANVEGWQNWEAVLKVEGKNSIDYPGVSLNIDCAFNAGTSYFAGGSYEASIDIGFHHISKSSTYPDNTWDWVNNIETRYIAKNLLGSETWGYKGIYPYYGWYAANGDPRSFLSESDSEIKAMSLSEVKAKLVANGAIVPDRSSSKKDDGWNNFPNPEVIGVRYLSNNGVWNSKYAHIPSSYSSFHYGHSVNPSNLSPGNSFTISARAGIGHDRYCVRIRVNQSDTNHIIWYSPVGTNNKVDNALLGIPDWNNSINPPEDWPPRWDAHFEKKVGNSWERVEAAGMRKNSDGTWSVF